MAKPHSGVYESSKLIKLEVEPLDEGPPNLTLSSPQGRRYLNASKQRSANCQSIHNIVTMIPLW